MMAARRDVIIQQSMRLFSLNGFLGTSLNDILEASQISKGGFFNYFKSKEDLFHAVLSEARKVWREKNLKGLDQIDRPIEKVVRILENYRDRYLKDAEHFPGGCLFVTLSVELDDLRPHLAKEVNEGFGRFKAMIKRFLDQARESGELPGGVSTQEITEMVFSGMLGASVLYGMDKLPKNLDRTIRALIAYLRRMSIKKEDDADRGRKKGPGKSGDRTAEERS
jgi:TetR/AcrR family transcriptional regulator, transcriptional repressor for nem operon